MPDFQSQFGLEPCTLHYQASNLTMLNLCYLHRHARSILPFVDTDTIVYLALAPWTSGTLGLFSLWAELAKSTVHHLFPFLVPYFFLTMKGQYSILNRGHQLRRRMPDHACLLLCTQDLISKTETFIIRMRTQRIDLWACPFPLHASEWPPWSSKVLQSE